MKEENEYLGQSELLYINEEKFKMFTLKMKLFC